MTVHIETDRLILRDWRDDDGEPFAALNADPRVMEFFPKRLARQESDAMMARVRGFIAEHGYGLYAAEEKSTHDFIGYIGLCPVMFAAAFTPATEIGWRLARNAWGSGYATEGATAVVSHALHRLGLTELVSFTAEWNMRSRRVMEKIGMTYDPGGDFLHPALPADDKLARQVLYRVQMSEINDPKRRRPHSDF